MFSTCARCSSRSRIAAASTSPPHAKTVRSEDLNRRRQLVNLAVALLAMCPVALQVERLLARYNAQGPQALGDLRRRNGTSPSVLRPDLLDKLKDRLREPSPDGGLWTSPKVAAWMAGELGLATVLPQRGWEALKAINWSVQKPRPRHPG